MAGAQDLRDRACLIDLVSRYALAVDDRDVPAIAACFTDDAHVEFDGGAEVVDGRAELTAFFESALQRPMMGTVGVSTHLMSNVLVTVDGDRAHVETQAVAYLASAERDTIVVRGLRYSDDCVRRGDGWLVQHRVHRSLWQGELAGGPRSPNSS
jgi:ketosteroid isomerase-like protein